MAKQKTEKVTVVSPVGRFSFPYLSAPDTGRTYSDDKYKTDLLIKKEDWKLSGKPLMDAVLKVARDFYGKPKIQLKDFKNPFTDMDTVDDCDPKLKGHIRIRAKSEFQPRMYGPDKERLEEEAVKTIKGGDYGRIVVAVYPYSQQGGGVTLGLNAVQFARTGEALGQGDKAILEMLDEIEVTEDDLESVEEETEEAEEKPAKSKRGRPKKEEVEEAEDEDADFDFA